MNFPFWRISSHSDLAALYNALDMGFLWIIPVFLYAGGRENNCCKFFFFLLYVSTRFFSSFLFLICIFVARTNFHCTLVREYTILSTKHSRADEDCNIWMYYIFFLSCISRSLLCIIITTTYFLISRWPCNIPGTTSGLRKTTIFEIVKSKLDCKLFYQRTRGKL
jgi:hypothetical protein